MAFALLASLACVLPTPSVADADRPASWAEPVEREGLPNLHRVSATLWRSAQPTHEGMLAARDLGVTTVVDLRSFHGDGDELEGTGLGSVHIFAKPWHPELEDVRAFLRVAVDPARQPVLVHCQRGADRTGLMCAAYRMVVQGWSKDAALDEMRGGGFGFDSRWEGIVETVRELDVAALRAELGLAASDH
ncbi:MAG: tyrosine-protein phosphatase [Planctomycetes bacterium]|nr:tyrosine-protein phosphatase [Planctomycetota bacterium]